MQQPYTLLLFALSILFASCSNEQQSQRAAIEAQEAKTDTTATKTEAETLIQLYTDYRGAYPEDAVFNPKYLYREATLHYRLKAYEKAAALLEELIADYPEASVRPQAAHMLGDIYEENMRQLPAAYTIYQALQEAYPEHPQTAKAQERLPEGIADPANRLEELRLSVFSDSTGQINYRTAYAFINSSKFHALMLPQEEASPNLLYRAGEIARAIRDYEEALALYSHLTEQYPEHPHASKALFMQAFTLDDNLKQFDKARDKYERFLEAYPQDDFADDAKVLLENLGKDDQEIIDNLTKKQQESE